MTVFPVREAGAADAPRIAPVVEAAFGGPGEARLVEALDAGGHAVLSLVAEDEHGIVGHVMFSRLVVEGAPSPLKATALAPVSVMPGRQGQGIGSSLIRAGHERLAAAGEDVAVVLGDPDYYRRFGYDPALAESFESEWAGPYLMAITFRPLDAAALSGRLVYPPPFADL